MNLCITVYCYGGIAAAVLDSHQEMVDTFRRAGHVVDLKHEGLTYTRHMIREDALISRSRCRSTARAMDTNCEAWFQIDHDIQFDSKDILDMCRMAVDRDAAICGVYPCRGFPIRTALRPQADYIITKVGEDRLVPITFFASGFLALPASAIMKTIEICSSDAVPPKYRIEWCSDNRNEVGIDEFPTLWMPLVQECESGAKEYLSEDYACSARMRLAGIPQFAWLKPKLKHWGEYAYQMPSD